MHPQTNRSFFSASILAFLGFNATIIIHELGHFLSACFFKIPTPTFSIGFGPALWKIVFKKTTFQFSLLPFGGYVLIDPGHFQKASLISQYIVTCAGICFNLLFAYIIFLIFSLQKKHFFIEDHHITISSDSRRSSFFSRTHHLFVTAFRKINELTILMFAHDRTVFIGPFSILKGLITTAQDGIFLYLLSIAFLNINLAIFNLLPLPFLDGSKLVQITVEYFFGKQPFSVILAICLFTLFMVVVILAHRQKQELSVKDAIEK